MCVCVSVCVRACVSVCVLSFDELMNDDEISIALG